MLFFKSQSVSAFARVSLLLLLALSASGSMGGCSSSNDSSGGQTDEVFDLGRGGKADGMGLSFSLTDSGPTARIRVRCDQPKGCDGHIQVETVSPSPCELLGIKASKCKPGMRPAQAVVAVMQMKSVTEGERELPLRVETADGDHFTTSAAAAFAAQAGETVSFVVTKTSDIDTLELDVTANWKEVSRPDPTASGLEAFLSTIEGLTFEETTTAYAGYRSFLLKYEQPLDHNDASSGTFTQQIVLHHYDESAPMVLFTSGYQLFSQDYLAELTEMMPANQINVEQRFFGSSVPSKVTTKSWQYVTIEQAAKDHHRIVEALRPYYERPWIGTGHSKGGMTSIYHRRFFPDDVDATVAYVAPISFGAPDPRYEDFLDQIGSKSCRERVRAMQARAFKSFHEIQPVAEDMARRYYKKTYKHANENHAMVFANLITQMDWVFWQGAGIEQCNGFPDESQMIDHDVGMFFTLKLGYGMDDGDCENAYNYQAMSQLGYQAFSTRAFEKVLPFELEPCMCAPAKSKPVYDPNAMKDIQDWVLNEASELIFVYGEYDPWTGGRFETPSNERVVDVTVPKANHGAMIKGLDRGDYTLVIDSLNKWIGVRPTVSPEWAPSHAPMAPRILHEGLPASDSFDEELAE